MSFKCISFCRDTSVSLCITFVEASHVSKTVSHYKKAVFILAGIFDLVLVVILRRKCLIVLVTFESFESFIVLVDEKSLHIFQLLVKLQLTTFILVAILYVVFKQK